MITEDYVSFETAKLLKEKGFDEGCSFVVNSISKGVIPVSLPTTNSDIEDEKANLIALPTLQMACKWLREVHNWTICISPYWPEGDMRNKLTWYYDIHSLIDNRSFRESSYTDNYTEACEAAIKYCLENLINKKEGNI